MASGLIDAGAFVAVAVAAASLLPDTLAPASSLVPAVMAATFLQFVMEVGLGRTLGKLVTGTRVVDCKGGKPSTRQLFDRAGYKGRPFLNAHSLLREVRARHDRLSGTFVVRSARPWRTASSPRPDRAPQRPRLS